MRKNLCIIVVNPRVWVGEVEDMVLGEPHMRVRGRRPSFGEYARLKAEPRRECKAWRVNGEVVGRVREGRLLWEGEARVMAEPKMVLTHILTMLLHNINNSDACVINGFVLCIVK